MGIYSYLFFINSKGRMHGTLAKAGKVKKQTPKVDKMVR